MAGLPEENSLDPERGGDTTETNAPGGLENSQDSTAELLECPICLQPCMHPVELPCHHVFCFLCIKGVAMQGPHSRCAICRAAIPYTALTNPHLKDVSQLYKEPKLTNGYQWYYESRSGGWWQYDERTMQELERAYASKQQSCQLLLAGHLYMVDFVEMIQYRSNNRNVSRRIRREVNLEKRGVAGIRIAGHSSTGGPGSSGGANGSPPRSSSGGGRRRRGNAAASNTVHQASASGHSSTAVGVSHPHVPATAHHNNPNQNTLPGSSSNDNDLHSSDSDDESLDEDEDYESYSEEDEADDDMEIGEEEEALIGDDSDEQETEDEEEYDTRDGARAPTRRSDRSNSSNNQTPPPPSGSGVSNGASGRTYSPNSNGRGSRGARSGRSSGGGRSNGSNSNNGASSRAVSLGIPDTTTAASQQPSSASPNVLASLLYSRCNVQDVVSRSNVSNNNIYVDSLVIGRGNYGVSQSFGSITTSATNFRMSCDSRDQHNPDEYL